MKIECVLFDLGNTLVSYFTTDQFREILRHSIASCCRVLAELGYDFNDREIYTQALALTGEREDLAVYPLLDRLQILFDGRAEAYAEPLTEAFMRPILETAIPDPDAVPLLARLRQQGIKTGILSNTPWGSPARVWHAEIRRHGLAEHVDLVLFCVEVGRRKPHGDIFQEALDRLQVRAQSTLFVGDDVRWDIQGAENAGITPVLLDTGTANGTRPACVINRLAELPRMIESLSE